MSKRLILTGDEAKSAAKRYIDEATIGHVFKIEEPKKKRGSDYGSNQHDY